MKKKELWKFVIQTAISILSAIATVDSVCNCYRTGRHVVRWTLNIKHETLKKGREPSV